jgi:hypothetical protein
VVIPNTNRCNFSNTRLERYVVTINNYVYFLGKGTRSLHLDEEKMQDRIKLFDKKYDEYKIEAEEIIKTYFR